MFLIRQKNFKDRKSKGLNRPLEKPRRQRLKSTKVFYVCVRFCNIIWSHKSVQVILEFSTNETWPKISTRMEAFLSSIGEWEILHQTGRVPEFHSKQDIPCNISEKPDS